MQPKSWSTIFTSLYSVFTLRNSLLLAMVAFIAQVGFAFTETFLPIFTVKALGWTDQAYSRFFALASLVGGIGGMLIGGILIDRFGKLRMLNIYFFLLISITAGLAFSKPYWDNVWLISGFMIAYELLYVFTCIGIFATAMECCWKKVSATQFTLYMTIANLGRIAGAKLIGPVKDQFSWEYTLLFLALAMALSWIVTRFIHINQQVEQISSLENKSQLRAIVTVPEQQNRRPVYDQEREQLT
jgi:PAT family beta-lactamase induction signal transducer AmpG